jgi:DNA-binding transcriptional LysR family regulator
LRPYCAVLKRVAVKMWATWRGRSLARRRSLRRPSSAHRAAMSACLCFGPQTPDDLANHNCINLRHQASRGNSVWDLEKDGGVVNVRVEGQLVVNDIAVVRQAAVDGVGLCYLPRDYLRAQMDAGELVPVLKEWCPPFPIPLLPEPPPVIACPRGLHSCGQISRLRKSLHLRRFSTVHEPLSARSIGIRLMSALGR